jgi:hypothetical protein
VGQTWGEPLDVAGLEVGRHGDWRGAFERGVGCEFHIGDGDEEVRAGSMLLGDNASGLEFDFGGADGVFDPEDLFGATLEDVEAAGFLPLAGGAAELVVLQEFDGEVAEGLVGLVVGDVGVGGVEEVGLSVAEGDRGGGPALHGVDDLGVSEGDIDVVVTVPVQESVGVRGDVDVEDADLVIGEDLVMVGLGSDFYFGLGGEESGQKNEEESAAHGRDCSSGQGLEVRGQEDKLS